MTAPEMRASKFAAPCFDKSRSVFRQPVPALRAYNEETK